MTAIELICGLQLPLGFISRIRETRPCGFPDIHLEYSRSHPLSRPFEEEIFPIALCDNGADSYDKNTWNVRHAAGESTCVALRRWSRYLKSLTLIIVVVVVVVVDTRRRQCRDVSAGRTMLGRAAIHLNVHGALTNCATCIVATGGGCCTRPIGQLLDFARERTVKWHSGGGGFWKSVTRAYFYSPPDLHVGEKRHRGEFYETRLHRQTRNCRKILIDLSSWFANRFTKVICYAFRFLRLDPIDVVWCKNWFMYCSGSAAVI